MAKKQSKQTKQRSVEELLRDQMIIQLTLAGVGQHQTRKIVGGALERVVAIAKLIKTRKVD